MTEAVPESVVCPGEVLCEWIVETAFPRHFSWEVYDIPEETLDRLLSGDQELNVDLAVKLARMTHFSPGFWLFLEGLYRAGLASDLPHPHD